MRIDVFGLWVPFEHQRYGAFQKDRAIIRMRRLILLGWLVAMLGASGTALVIAKPVYLLAVWASGLICLGNLMQYEEAWGKALAVLFYGTSDKAWMAEFDRAFTKEYPRWREFAALRRRHSPEFVELKNELEAEWLEYKPKYRFNLSREALLHVVGFKHDTGKPKGLVMHKIYRNWEIAQDSVRILRRNR